MRFGADLSYLWKPIARPESYLFSRGNVSLAFRRKISVVASAVAAAMRITVKNNRKMPIQKATNIIMSLKPKPYSTRIMAERPPSSMSTWGRVFENPPS